MVTVLDHSPMMIYKRAWTFDDASSSIWFRHNGRIDRLAGVDDKGALTVVNVDSWAITTLPGPYADAVPIDGGRIATMTPKTAPWPSSPTPSPAPDAPERAAVDLSPPPSPGVHRVRWRAGRRAWRSPRARRPRAAAGRRPRTRRSAPAAVLRRRSRESDCRGELDRVHAAQAVLEREPVRQAAPSPAPRRRDASGRRARRPTGRVATSPGPSRGAPAQRGARLRVRDDTGDRRSGLREPRRASRRPSSSTTSFTNALVSR